MVRQSQSLGEGGKHSRQRTEGWREAKNIPRRQKNPAKMFEIRVSVVPLRTRQVTGEAVSDKEGNGRS